MPARFLRLPHDDQVVLLSRPAAWTAIVLGLVWLAYLLTGLAVDLPLPETDWFGLVLLWTLGPALIGFGIDQLRRRARRQPPRPQ